MATSIYNSCAVVVLPPVRNGAVRAKDIRRWLSRTDIEFTEEPANTVDRVIAALGHPPLASGYGALRMWGQTGDRPTVWMAAADPVFLEPRLDHLCLHRLLPEEIPPHDMGQLFDELQSELGADDALGFVQIGRYGYLRGEQPLTTPSLSADSLHGREPSPWMPTGDESAAYHRLHSEIQMALHLSDVHRRREAAGKRDINALWIWGGGTAAEPAARAIPPLFSGDPLLRGYWRSASGVIAKWSGNLADCAGQAPDGFVAVIPHALTPSTDGLDPLSRHLKDALDVLHASRLKRLVLLFADGVTAGVRRRHRWRLWRRPARELDAETTA